MGDNGAIVHHITEHVLPVVSGSSSATVGLHLMEYWARIREYYHITHHKVIPNTVILLEHDPTTRQHISCHTHSGTISYHYVETS